MTLIFKEGMPISLSHAPYEPLSVDGLLNGMYLVQIDLIPSFDYFMENYPERMRFVVKELPERGLTVADIQEYNEGLFVTNIVGREKPMNDETYLSRLLGKTFVLGGCIPGARDLINRNGDRPVIPLYLELLYESSPSAQPVRFVNPGTIYKPEGLSHHILVYDANSWCPPDELNDRKYEGSIVALRPRQAKLLFRRVLPEIALVEQRDGNI